VWLRRGRSRPLGLLLLLLLLVVEVVEVVEVGLLLLLLLLLKLPAAQPAGSRAGGARRVCSRSAGRLVEARP
jgi:hypothetical protein